MNDVATQTRTHIPTLHCRWVELISTLGEPEVEPKFRRTHRRYPCNGEIKVRFATDEGMKQRTWSLIQVSSEGITAIAPEEVPDRFRIDIEWHREDEIIMLSGRIVHCTQTIGGYKIGVKLKFSR